MGVRGNLMAVAVVALGAVGANSWISVHSVIPADVAKQSDFFRTYDPVPLMNSFRAGCITRSGVGTGSWAGPGYLFLSDARNVRYTRTARTDLCDETRNDSILAAVHRHLLAALRYSGCRVSSDEMSTGRGVRIVYRCGTRTAGFVSATTPSSLLTLQVDEEWSVRDPS